MERAWNNLVSTMNPCFLILLAFVLRDHSEMSSIIDAKLPSISIQPHRVVGEFTLHATFGCNIKIGPSAVKRRSTNHESGSPLRLAF